MNASSWRSNICEGLWTNRKRKAILWMHSGSECLEGRNPDCVILQKVMILNRIHWKLLVMWLLLYLLVLKEHFVCNVKNRFERKTMLWKPLEKTVFTSILMFIIWKVFNIVRNDSKVSVEFRTTEVTLSNDLDIFLPLPCDFWVIRLEHTKSFSCIWDLRSLHLGAQIPNHYALIIFWI